MQNNLHAEQFLAILMEVLEIVFNQKWEATHFGRFSWWRRDGSGSTAGRLADYWYERWAREFESERRRIERESGDVNWETNLQNRDFSNLAWMRVYVERDMGLTNELLFGLLNFVLFWALIWNLIMLLLGLFQLNWVVL